MIMKTESITAFTPQERIPSDTGNMTPGTLHLANEARLSQATFSEGLTHYATGWKPQDDLQEQLDFIAPPVQVSRRFDFKKATNAEEFLSESDDVRAIGADFKRIEYKGSEVSSKTLNKGLAYRFDRDESNLPGWEESVVRRMLDRLMRNELRRAGTALLALDSPGTDKVWGSGGTDPDSDMIAAISAAGDEAGIDANRILLGSAPWRHRRAFYAASDKAAGFAGLPMTPELLAQEFGVDGIRVCRERFQSDSSTKSHVFGAYAVAFHAQPETGLEDPSTLKRFYTPVDGGGMYKVHRIEVGAKFIDIVVEHYSNIVATSSVGVKRLNVSDS